MNNFTDQVNNPAPKSVGQGFGKSQNQAQPKGKGAKKNELRGAVTAGLGTVVTNQVTKTAEQLRIAMEFSEKNAKALAKHAKPVLNGEYFTQQFLTALNEECAEMEGFEFEDLQPEVVAAEFEIEDLGKQLLLAETTAPTKFLPSGF